MVTSASGSVVQCFVVGILSLPVTSSTSKKCNDSAEIAVHVIGFACAHAQNWVAFNLGRDYSENELRTVAHVIVA